MRAVRDTDCNERSESAKCKSAQERGRAKSNNRYREQRQSTKSERRESESQRGSETRGEVLLLFLVCTVEYICYMKI